LTFRCRRFVKRVLMVEDIVHTNERHTKRKTRIRTYKHNDNIYSHVVKQLLNNVGKKICKQTSVAGVKER